MQIRQIQPSDALPIFEILRAAWLEAYINAEYGITVKHIEEFYANKRERLTKLSQNFAEAATQQVCWVAEEEGSVMGFVRILPEENKIKALYVHPNFHRQGVGSMLIRHVLAQLDPTKSIVLNVAQYNTRAIGFYKKFGFEDLGQKPEQNFRFADGTEIPEITLCRNP